MLKRDAKHLFPMVVIALVLGLLFAMSGCRFIRQDSSTSASRTHDAPRAGQSYCPIDGELAAPAVRQRRPIAVLIENSPSARPQSGLREACVVYEAITEGGITRFLAVYLHADPPKIGPVRSARPHFIDLSREYNAVFVHCGQSYEALQILATDSTIDHIDEMRDTKLFWRDRARKAPHNLYTSSERLRTQMEKWRWEMPYGAVPSFATGKPLRTGDAATTVEIRFPGAYNYQLRLVYDRKQGGYLRYMNGKLHVDREDGAPIIARNVIVQRVNAQPYAHSALDTIDVDVLGVGEGQLFSNGFVQDLRWTRTRRSGGTSFTDTHGKALPLQSGQSWVEIVPVKGEVTVTAPPLTPP